VRVLAVLVPPSVLVLPSVRVRVVAVLVLPWVAARVVVAPALSLVVVWILAVLAPLWVAVPVRWSAVALVLW
jgi:hypothetical protein